MILPPFSAGRARAIVEAVSSRTGVSSDEILGTRGKPRVSSARQLAYLELAEAGAGYAQIGRLMRRHHTTIMHGVRVARYQREVSHG